MPKYVKHFRIGSQIIDVKDPNALPNNESAITQAVSPIVNNAIETYVNSQDFVDDVSPIADDRINAYVETPSFENAVSEIADDRIDNFIDNELEEIIKPIIPRKVNASQIANHLSPSSETYFYMQGGDYISDDVIVFARKAGMSAPDNNVQLVKLNTKLQSVVLTNTITGYHCNSVCYNPKTGKIYANAYYDHANPSTWVNRIFVINPTTLAIESTITPVLAQNAQGVYSMAVDKTTGKWYLVENIGTTVGLSNRVVVYSDSTFQTIEKTITLDNWPYSINGSIKNTQGIMCVHEGIMYGLVYGMPTTIVAFNMSGKVVGKYVVDALNQYMPITEAECLFYHEGIGNLVLGAMTVVSSGAETYQWYQTFSEIGVLNEVVEWLPVYRENLQPQNVNVYLSDTDVYGWWCETTVLKTIEAASAALSIACPGRQNGTININRTTPIVGTTINGFKGKIRGGTLHGIVCVDCDVDFTDVTILPSAEYVDDAIVGSLVGVRSNIILSGSTTVSWLGGTGNIDTAVAITYGSKLSGVERVTGRVYATDSIIIPSERDSYIPVSSANNHVVGACYRIHNGQIAVNGEYTFDHLTAKNNYNIVRVSGNASCCYSRILRENNANTFSVNMASYSTSQNTFKQVMIAGTIDFNNDTLTITNIETLEFSSNGVTKTSGTNMYVLIELLNE